MRIPGFALCAALLLASPPRASYADDGLVLEVAEEITLNDDPFRAPVTFVLRPKKTPWPDDGGANLLEGIRRWQIQIFDFDERKVGFLQGKGRPPRRVSWDGAAPDGKLLRDGFYTTRLVWLDAAGTARRSETVKVGLLTPRGLNDFAGSRLRVVYTRDRIIIRLSEDATFSPGEWTLRPHANATLKKIANFLQRYPRNRLLVIGHADASGSLEANREISLKRARTIKRFLSEHGVDGNRIMSEGHGADEPITSNATAEGRERNRRVEIVLLKATI